MKSSQINRALEINFRHGFRSYQNQNEWVESQSLWRLFYELLVLLKRLGPLENETDLIWEGLWIVSDGPRRSWYESSFHIYENIVYVTLDNRYGFQANLKEKKFCGVDLTKYGGAKSQAEELLKWWLRTLIKQISKVIKDANAYNKWIAKILPLKHRWGKVQRKTLWAQTEDKLFIRDELTSSDIQRFQKTVVECQTRSTIKDMSRDDFLKCCAIAYDAIYPKEGKYSLVERYRLHADGRDDGLLSNTPDDTVAFKKWIKTKPIGGHPWEIVRGGNTTHISLYLGYSDDEWEFLLAGDSPVCVARTVKMANALNKKKIKFDISKKDHLLQMVQGEDWIGIVPINVFPGGNYSVFERFGDKILNEMNLGDWAKDKKIMKLIKWYPPQPLRLRSRMTAAESNSLKNSERNL